MVDPIPPFVSPAPADPYHQCATAIRYAGFRECIYATSIEKLTAHGWPQMNIHSHTVFEESFRLPTKTELLGEFLTNETDPLLTWQFDRSQPCPRGCRRDVENLLCLPKE